jgi:phosphoserine phosphatase
VELLDAADVVARLAAAMTGLERVAGPPGGTAGVAGAIAFDGDGTLWSGDVGEDFFHAVVTRGRILPVAVEAMRRVAERAGIMVGAAASEDAGVDTNGHSRDSGVALARSLFQAYLDHTLAEDVICEVIAWVCAGWSEGEVDAFARDVVASVDLAARRHAPLRAIIDWARASGVEPFLVSASPRPIVEAAGAAWGFRRDRILATTAPFEGGIMLPDVVRPIPYGPGKASLLEAALAALPRAPGSPPPVLLGAFGDNAFDVPMLEAARVAVVVEPKPRLLAHLASLPQPGAGFFGGAAPVRVRV